MKTNLLTLSGLFLALILIIPGCSKKKDPEPTTEQLLTRTNGWKVTGAKVNGVDVFSSLPACITDDIYKFTLTGSNSSGGGYIDDEGATKCDASDDQTSDSGTWVLNSAKTQLTLTSAADNSIQLLMITTLNSTTLIVTFSIVDSGVTVSAQQTLTGL